MGFAPSRLGDEGTSTPRAVKHPTVRDIERAAGYFEGEGTTSKNGKSSTTVSVKQKDPWILLWLQDRFGGTVKERTYLRKGYGESELITNSTWTIHGPRARGFLMTIYSLLSPRRQLQARRALGIF